MERKEPTLMGPLEELVSISRLKLFFFSLHLKTEIYPGYEMDNPQNLSHDFILIF
jgi:hypothetical protein